MSEVFQHPRLRCPSCKIATFKMKDVWYPDQPESRLKCSRCGEWSQLQAWKETTKQAWLKMAEALNV